MLRPNPLKRLAMEPLGIFGAIAACSQLATLITRVTKNVALLKRQWKDGERSLQLLIIRLSTIRAALTQIKDWSEFGASSASGEELRESLDVAMEGCQVIVEALDQDITSLLGDSVAARLRHLFDESRIRDHERRLDSQIAALQLLVNAAHW
jgi:hypothetical protein